MADCASMVCGDRVLSPWVSRPVRSRTRQVRSESGTGAVKKEALYLLLGNKNAVAPDLWLFTGRRHRFIEVKLPGDHLGDSQLAGLALIATCLKAALPVSVEVVTLVADSVDDCRLSEGEPERFKSFCEALTAGWRWRDEAVDRGREHIEIPVGDASNTAYGQWVPVALVGRPVGSVFPVQWLTSTKNPTATEVRKRARLRSHRTPREFPWSRDTLGTTRVHHATTANVYSSVHWSYFPEGMEAVEIGTRRSQAAVEPPKLFGDGGGCRLHAHVRRCVGSPLRSSRLAPPAGGSRRGGARTARDADASLRAA